MVQPETNLLVAVESMTEKAINPNSIVANLLDDCPQVIPVFIKYRMSCVGCSMAGFETLADAVRIYGIEWDGFLRDLNRSMQE